MATRQPADTGAAAAQQASESQSGSAAEERSRIAHNGSAIHRRFDRMARLIGEDSAMRLGESHAMVIGLGGVGSFAAESLARSGVGELTLVDFDKVCVTNSNRQLQALAPTVGWPKVTVLSERLSQVNPQAIVRALETFYAKEQSEQILGLGPDVVVDAIDNITAKCHLLAECRKRQIPVVTSLGAAGRLDPTAIEVADLARTKLDHMARIIRKILRQKYAFPRRGSFGISAVYSCEPAREPFEVHYDDAAREPRSEGTNGFHSPDRRRVINGSASFVTGTFGLVCASVAVQQLLGWHPSR